MIDLKITPQREAFVEGFDNEFYALLQVSSQNNETSQKRDKSLNIAIVIDRSGSMSGGPLEEAKRCAIMMVEKMHPSDRVSIVAYDNHSELIVPSSFCSEKQEIITLINSVFTGGMTALHEGWLMGAEEVAKNKTPNSINRVLLLSDGNANIGIDDIDELKNQCAKLADVGVTTSTYGLGLHFNEDLMIEMASSGLGQGYYGETAEDLSDPFQEEFALLLNTIATNVRLSASAPKFIKLQLMNNLRDNGNDWSMPDLALGGEAWALFKINLDKTHTNQGPLELLKCFVKYKNMNGKEIECEPAKLILEPLHPNAFAMIEEDKKVKTRISEVIVSSYQQEAKEAAKQNDWSRVDRIISEAKKIAADDPWMSQSLHSLEKYSKRRQQDHFTKAAMYSSDRMNKRLVALNEHEGSFDSLSESGKISYLRRKIERGKKM